MRIRNRKKSTIVRLVSVGMSLPLLGCAAGTSSPAVRAPCAAGAQPVCETFATERRCDCTSRAELDRVLATFGSGAWPGGNH
jgi:hypothetical protein